MIQLNVLYICNEGYGNNNIIIHISVFMRTTNEVYLVIEIIIKKNRIKLNKNKSFINILKQKKLIYIYIENSIK